MMSPQQIIEKIRKSPKIPAPSQTVFRILSLTRSRDCDLNKVATLIGSDAGLTAQLLREANSALFAGSKATSSVLQACVRLGLKRVRAAVINQHVVSGLGKTCPPGFNAQRLFQSALATSVAAQDLCKEIQKDLSDDAGTAGLLCDIGMGLMAFGAPQEYQPVLAELKQPAAEPPHRIELRLLKVTHADVGAAVLADWGLDQHILDAVLHHHREPAEADALELDKFPRIVQAAVTLARLALDGSDMDAVALLFAQVEPLTPKADEVVSRLLDVLVTHIQETAQALAVELGETAGMEENLSELLRDLQAAAN
jgi:HD-like signal output (HDOD) protein